MFIYLVFILFFMETGYKVCDAMTNEPVMVSKEASLMECASIMKNNHVGALIVNDNDILYIVTEQDIIRKAVAEGLDPEETEVSKVMTKADNVIEPQQDIFEALVKMRDLNIRHLPVVSEKKMIGLLTLKDILKIEPQLFDLMAEKIELREEERKPIKRVKEQDGVCNLCGNYSEDLTEKEGVLVCGECSKP